MADKDIYGSTNNVQVTTGRSTFSPKVKIYHGTSGKVHGVESPANGGDTGSYYGGPGDTVELPNPEFRYWANDLGDSIFDVTPVTVTCPTVDSTIVFADTTAYTADCV